MRINGCTQICKSDCSKFFYRTLFFYNVYSLDFRPNDSIVERPNHLLNSKLRTFCIADFGMLRRRLKNSTARMSSSHNHARLLGNNSPAFQCQKMPVIRDSCEVSQIFKQKYVGGLGHCNQIRIEIEILQGRRQITPIR